MSPREAMGKAGGEDVTTLGIASCPRTPGVCPIARGVFPSDRDPKHPRFSACASCSRSR